MNEQRVADERSTLRLTLLCAALIAGQHVAGKALREGLFLSTFSTADVPRAVLGSALLAIPVTLLVGGWLRRLGHGRLVPAAFALGGLASLLEWALLPHLPRGAALLLYFHVSVGGSVLMSLFWSTLGERWDPSRFKRLVGRIGAAATLGGLLGAVAMERAAHWLDARSTLLLLGPAGLVIAAGMRRLTLHGESLAQPAGAPPASRASARGYVWTLALLVAASAAASTCADIGLKQAVALRFESPEDLVRFFAVLYTAASLLGFVLQAFASRWLLERLGVGGTLLVTPASGLVLAALASLMPSFFGLAVLRGTDLALGPSLFRSGFEPLFTPLSAESRRSTKALVDVVFDKGGDALAGSLFLWGGLAQLGPARVPAMLAASAFALSLGLALLARRGYPTELERALRAGLLRPGELDDLARLTLSRTAAGLDHATLRDRIVLYRPPTAAARAPGRGDDQLAEHTRVLTGCDEAAMRAVLCGPALDPRLANLVAAQLGSAALLEPALAALRAMGPDTLGALESLLLDEAQPVTVRRRVPYVLRAWRDPRVVHVLLRALSVEALEVRHRAASTLLVWARETPSLVPSAATVAELVVRELAGAPLGWQAREHVLTLLELLAPGASWELIRRGMRSDDARLRGTALEYLEGLLPEAVRTRSMSALIQAPH